MKLLLKTTQKKTYINKKLSAEFHRILMNVFVSMINENYKYINVSRVRLTRDMNNVTVFFTSSIDFSKELALEFLKNELFILKKKLSVKWHHRKLPRIYFKYDEELLELEKITTILEKIKS